MSIKKFYMEATQIYVGIPEDEECPADCHSRRDKRPNDVEHRLSRAFGSVFENMKFLDYDEPKLRSYSLKTTQLYLMDVKSLLDDYEHMHGNRV